MEGGAIFRGHSTGRPDRQEQLIGLTGGVHRLRERNKGPGGWRGVSLWAKLPPAWPQEEVWQTRVQGGSHTPFSSAQRRLVA